MMGSYKILKTARFAEDRTAFPEWLAAELRERRVMTAKIVPESFGWSMKLRSVPFGMRVECGSRNEAQTEWGVYVVAEATMFERMFRRVAVRQELDRLTKVLDRIVNELPEDAEQSR